MNQSENINELVGALSKAQGAMKPASFNKMNPHFKSRYADLASCIEACRDPLSKNGLSVMQFVEQRDGQYYLVTMLAHISGQFIKSYLPMQLKNPTCQALGSELTYLKRYGISAILGIVADDDDDGNAASDSPKNNEPQKISIDQIRDINELLKDCDSPYVEKFLGFLQAKYGKRSLDVIPVSDFEGVIKYISNAMKLKLEEVK